MTDYAIPVAEFHVGMGGPMCISFEDRGAVYSVEAWRYKLDGDVVRIFRRDIKAAPAYMWLGRDAESL